MPLKKGRGCSHPAGLALVGYTLVEGGYGVRQHPPPREGARVRVLEAAQFLRRSFPGRICPTVRTLWDVPLAKRGYKGLDHRAPETRLVERSGDSERHLGYPTTGLSA